MIVRHPGPGPGFLFFGVCTRKAALNPARRHACLIHAPKPPHATRDALVPGATAARRGRTKRPVRPRLATLFYEPITQLNLSSDLLT
jgi:hypothetical protein